MEKTRFLAHNTQLDLWPLRPHPGFTLIELLVALSIMAVPALRAAMDRADRTVCLSNLRQLGQAFSEYTADHGRYPAAEMEVTDASGRVIERKRWYHALGPYLDSGPRAWSSGQGRVQVDPVTGQASGIVLPSEDDADTSAFSPVLRCPTVGHWQLGRNGAYGYNHQYLGDAVLVPVRNRTYLPVCLGEVRRASS